VKLPEFRWDAALLERCEHWRLPGRTRAIPGESEAERDARVQRDRLHRAVQRDEFLRQTYEALAAARGLQLTDKLVPIQALIYGVRSKDQWGVVPPEILTIESASLMTVAMRGSGAGAKMPSQIYNVPLPRIAVDRAVSMMRGWGVRPKVLPFSFINPRGCHALYIAPKARDT